jgi:spore maturation protein CgeB
MVTYPGHAVSTLDVAKGIHNALKRTGEHEIAHFDYHRRLAFYKEAMRHFEEINPNFNPPEDGFMALASEAIVTEVVDFVPDVVLIINGMALHRNAFHFLYRLKIPYVFLLTESPYADNLQALAVKNSNSIGAFVNDRNSVLPVAEMSGAPTVYLPHSFDPNVHYRRKNVAKKYRTDIFFYGTLWPERQKIIRAVEKNTNGYKAIIGGVDPAVIKEKIEDLQIIPNEEMTLYYNGTKIAINHNRTVKGIEPEEIVNSLVHIEPGDAYSLGPRAYEIAACGAFQLSDNSRGELKEVFGDTVATYQDEDDLIAKLDYYLTHDAERQEMADAAHERVQDCTFDNRVKNIVIPFLQEVL